jgi:hypothetical protein
MVFIEQLKWMIKHIQNGDGKYLPKVSKKGYLEQALSFLENVPHSLYPYRIFLLVLVDNNSTYTKWGWEISPEGFLEGLHMLKARYGDIKMYVTENGLGDEDLFDKNHQKKGYLEQALSFLENVPHSLYPYRIFLLGLMLYNN